MKLFISKVKVQLYSSLLISYCYQLILAFCFSKEINSFSEMPPVAGMAILFLLLPK